MTRNSTCYSAIISILQAWHRTYDALLEEIEETYFYTSLEKMLDGMAAQVSAAAAEIGNGALKQSAEDADYFLSVARALLAGSNAPSARSSLGQNERVVQTLADVRAEKLMPLELMGFCRMVDFSLSAQSRGRSQSNGSANARSLGCQYLYELVGVFARAFRSDD